SLLCYSMLPRPPRPTLFPYTTLFRSWELRRIRSPMAKARIEDRTEGRATAPREIAVFARASFTLMIALLFVLLLDSLGTVAAIRSEEHTSELQSRENLVCRLLLEKKK